MDCDLQSCYFYLFLSALAAIGIYIIGYIILYIYIANITYKYNSNDIIAWKEAELVKVENKYQNMPI